jgi:hypothetical protein
MYIRGSEKTDNTENKNNILNSCISIIEDNFPNLSPEKNINIDCDAFSFVIIADNMNSEAKKNIKNFLHTFGTTLSSISIPSQAVGANKIDSIFGSTRSVGCQHLESHIIGKHLMSEEALVINSPIKIAVHHSCRKMIISHLCKYPNQYPMAIATSKDICFDPNMASNKPPYGVIVDAIIDSSFDSMLGKYIIHVADMGTRHEMKIDDDECPIQIMFDNIEILRKTSGVSVEMSQLDIAFNLPTTGNKLIQCSHEKLHTMTQKKNDSFVDYLTAEQWALHEIQTKDGKVDSDNKQKGTVRLKNLK